MDTQRKFRFVVLLAVIDFYLYYFPTACARLLRFCICGCEFDRIAYALRKEAKKQVVRIVQAHKYNIKVK